MCSPKPPKQEVVAPPPPVAAPKPLASPDGTGGPNTLSQLRIGSKNNLKAAASSALTISKGA